jgi:transposase
MRVLYARCAGLDVHKDLIVACVRRVEGRLATHEIERFATTTRGLLELRAWLESHGCTHVAMEATGAYWKPVWHVLEDGFELVLANAAHIRNVPGRKSDVSDAAWISDLLEHGLIRASFVPPVAVQELRVLTRTRKQFVRERAAHVQRIEKVLEDANLKLGVVLTDIMGKSGRAVLEAIIAGHSEPEQLLARVNSRVKASRAEILEALRGRISAHHRFMLKLHLGHIDALDAAIAAIEKEVGLGLEPFRQAARRLSTMPGLNAVSASVVVAEIGLDMSRFKTPGHLLSWAGMCPRNDESAGKRRSTRLRHGGNWLKTTLVQCAWAAVRVKGSYLQAQFHRVRARRGAKMAILAVAASMLTAAWHMLRNQTDWKDLGAAHFDRADQKKTINRLLKRLRQLGVNAQLTPA